MRGHEGAACERGCEGVECERDMDIKELCVREYVRELCVRGCEMYPLCTWYQFVSVLAISLV